MKIVISIFFVFMMASCTADLSDYQKTSPAINIKDYFTGRIVAWGMIQNYEDKLIRHFCVEIDGSWEGNKGLLAEKFYFDDGEISYRNWQLTQLADGKYTGRAEDVIGTASGQEVGQAFNWVYQLSVPIDDSKITLTLDDWMYQLDKNRIFNKTTMKKFGIAVGEITLFFNKENNVNECQVV